MIARRFRRRRDGSVDITLHRAEAALLGDVLESLRGLVAGEQDAEDPALRRLYPAAYDDAEGQRDWESLTRDSLSQERIGRVERVLAAARGGSTKRSRWSATIPDEQVGDWLGAVNDARLVLGTRLEVTEEMYDDPPGREDPRRAMFEVYAFLGWLEAELLEAIDPGTTETTGVEP